MKYSTVEVSNNLKEYKFSFKKKFGQNFIIDENIVDNIISKSKIKKNSLIIEVGPGSGSLTYKLCKAAEQVICFEVDTSLKDILDNNLQEYNNVEIIYEDFLKVNLQNKLSQYEYDNLYLIANLPYYITTPIITKIIDEKIDVDKIVIMVQKEVGERFSAKPNSKDYNSLSVFLQYNFNINKIMDVSRNVFIPKPNVDSVVLELCKKEKKSVNDLNKFYKLVRDSFTQKRKNLRNNLKQYDLLKIESVLSKYGFDLNSRAEQLSLDIFIDLSNNL